MLRKIYRAALEALAQMVWLSCFALFVFGEVGGYRYSFPVALLLIVSSLLALGYQFSREIAKAIRIFKKVLPIGKTPAHRLEGEARHVRTRSLRKPPH